MYQPFWFCEFDIKSFFWKRIWKEKKISQILNLNKPIANLIETFSCILFFYWHKVIFTQLSFQVSIVNRSQFDILLKRIYFQLSLSFPEIVPDFVINPYTKERGDFNTKITTNRFLVLLSFSVLPKLERCLTKSQRTAIIANFQLAFNSLIFRLM